MGNVRITVVTAATALVALVAGGHLILRNQADALEADRSSASEAESSIAPTVVRTIRDTPGSAARTRDQTKEAGRRTAVSSPAENSAATTSTGVQTGTTPANDEQLITSFDVTFTCEGALESPSENDPVRLLVGDGSGSNAESHPWSSNAATVALPRGEYVAALAIGEGVVGPVASFTVLDAPLDVGLDAPAPLTLTFSVQSGTSGDLISGANVEVTRVDAAALDRAYEQERHVTSDGAGIVRFDALPNGTWAFIVSAEGHAERTWEMPLPGEWVDDLTADRTLHLGDIRLAVIRPLEIQLRGFADWGAGSGFRIAHLPDGEQFPFDDDGHVALPLSWFTEPLPLKLWYPGNQMAVLYLDAGLPPIGTPFEIDVHKG